MPERRLPVAVAAQALRALLAMLPLTAAAEPDDDDELIDAIVVSATRSGNVVGDEPVRVEVLPEEEIEENQSVQPGNLTTLLTELGGVRMQTTSTGLGGTALQMRGLPGRHTLVLQDGLPLLGAQTDGFGLLQTPPLDLGRVEVIKGVGSALYGASALGGVLNLVSRPPGGESEILLNRSSRGGTDAVLFASHQLDASRGFTLTTAINDQSREDVDDDAWADVASYRRYVLRPRLLWTQAATSVFATLGFMDEQRQGGTLPGETLSDGTSFRDGLSTRRIDGGLTTRTSIAGGGEFASRWSASRTDQMRTFGTDRIGYSLSTGYGEATVAGHRNRHAWLVGAAIQYEQLEARDAPPAAYRYIFPALFAQDDFSPADSLKLSISMRVDRHEYGTFFSPRLSALFKPAEDWSLRASVGSGFAAPSSLLEQIESTSLLRLLPPGKLQAERAANASLDAKWAEGHWEIEGSLFTSRIRHPLVIERAESAPDRFELSNGDLPQRVKGTEFLVRYVDGPLHVIGSSTYLDATEGGPDGRQRVDRTPRWSGELAALLEDEKRGRVGIELSYTRSQRLDDNPYRSAAPGYVELSALAAIRFGEISLFFNAIDLTNVRQSNYDPLLLPMAAPTGERVTSSWAPLAGRTFNLGLRAEL